MLLINSFFKPISILLDGYNDVISGDFKSNINVKREDELGLLGDAFNEMKKRIAIGSNKFLLMKRFNDDILRSIFTGIITTDMHGKIKNYNDAASGIIERVMCINEIKPDIVKILMMQVNETIKGLDCVNRVAPFKGFDIEETVYLDITTSLMKNSLGGNIGVICNFSDITNRKRIEDNVERINRLTSLDELTAALAHEIRNPLSGIKMSAQILNRRLFNNLKASDQNLFEAIIKETERLNFLITDLLNFSKPRAPNFQSIDVSEILDKALIFSKEKIREKKALVKVKYNINEKNIYLDKSQLSQIFLNIISNALDAIDIKGSLIISVKNSDESEDKYIRVTFEDDGCGIDEENISKIFDPFFTTRESELFGFEKNAFSGANSRKRGLLELAHGGTLLLDELGEMPIGMQSKLLRFIETKQFNRIGGLDKIEVDIRIIAATNKNLEEAIAKKEFREDLYYRLNVVPIFIPPLRERKIDIVEISKHFLSVFNVRFKKNFKGFTEDAIERMTSYSWPGNIRELKNIIERIVILNDVSIIDVSQLPGEMRKQLIANKNIEYVYEKEDSIEEGFSLEEKVADLEKYYIVKSLNKTRHNFSAASKLLGISRHALNRRMEKYFKDIVKDI